jgi:AraC-like DNA-binding protein
MMNASGLTGLSPCAVDVGQWWSETRANVLPMDLRIDQDAPFEVDARFARLPRACTVQVRTGDHTTSMGRAACESLDRKLVKVLWQHHGTARIEQGAESIEVPGGSWTMYEASRPFESRMRGNAEFSALLLNVAEDDRMLSLARRVAGRAFSTEGAAAVALTTIVATLNMGRQLDWKSYESVIDCVCSLLGNELHRLEGGAAGTRSRARQAIVHDAKRFVDRHLDDPDLTPDRIALTLHVSRRTLYNAFETIGETPQAFIQRRRMDRCKSILSQQAPESAQVSITQLALDVGFIDSGYFSRAFRKHFGQSPSQFRAEALALRQQ